MHQRIHSPKHKDFRYSDILIFLNSTKISGVFYCNLWAKKIHQNSPKKPNQKQPRPELTNPTQPNQAGKTAEEGRPDSANDSSSTNPMPKLKRGNSAVGSIASSKVGGASWGSWIRLPETFSPLKMDGVGRRNLVSLKGARKRPIFRGVLLLVLGSCTRLEKQFLAIPAGIRDLFGMVKWPVTLSMAG